MKFTPTFAVLLVSITASVLAAPYPNVPRSQFCSTYLDAGIKLTDPFLIAGGQGNLAAYGGQGKGSRYAQFTSLGWNIKAHSSESRSADFSPATKGKPSGGGRKQYQKPAPRYDDDDNSDGS